MYSHKLGRIILFLNEDKAEGGGKTSVPPAVWDCQLRMTGHAIDKYYYHYKPDLTFGPWPKLAPSTDLARMLPPSSDEISTIVLQIKLRLLTAVLDAYSLR